MVCYASMLHMFGAFSKLFKKPEPAPAPARPTGPQSLPRAAAPLPQALPQGETAQRPSVPRPSATQPSGGDSLVVPYAAIIKLIPQELWGKLAPAGVAGYNYTISRQSVLEQLPHGAVKVNFGELRRGAPSGVFINTAAEDGRMVDLPLSDILAQLHPDSLTRRQDQARVQISEEVPDLFGAKGERLAPLRVMEKKEISHTTSFARQKGSAPIPLNPVAPTAPIGSVPAAQPGNITPVPANLVVPVSPALAPNPVPAPTIRMQPLPSSTPTPPPASPKPSAPTGQIVPKPLAAVPIARPLPKIQAASPARPVPVPQPAVPLPSPAPAPVAPVTATLVTGTASFFIALDVVAAGWPNGVRQELAQLKIPDAKIALPPVDLCEGLKRGRIQYPWRTLRSWIQPPPIYATPSPHDDLVLELPLRTLTPLFLEFIRANPVNRQVADAGNITEFFRKAEQATSASADLLQPLFEPAPPSQSGELSQSAVAVPQATAPPFPVASLAAAAGQPLPTAEATIENEAFCLPVSLIANGFPEPVLRDVASFGLTNSRVEIPLASIELGLKVGRLEFSWRELGGWLNPPSKPAQVSINGENRIALPLGLIAPLFLKSRVAAQGRRKTAVAGDIPDLFSAAGKPIPPAAVPVEAPVPVAAAEAAPSPQPQAPSPQPQVPRPAAQAPELPSMPAPAPKTAPTNLSELFGEPNKKSWTPNEIVQRTTQLPNVAGALIALQDGLLVATNMPSEMKTETIAAFVPQIFGRLNQYSKELQLGDTRAVGFTVDSGTIQVYNAGIIYFAAFGKAGTLLPLSELQLIASELGRHTK